MREVGQVAVCPIEYDIEWKIDKFASLSGIYYFSPTFRVEDISWTFGIQPNGSPYTKSGGFIDLILYRSNSKGPPKCSRNVEFSFSLKNINQNKVNEKGFSFNFEEPGSCPVHKFMKREEFNIRQSEFISYDGVLTVVCTIRVLKSSQTASDIPEVTCKYCKKTFEAGDISLHEKKCLIKCPDCHSFVIYVDWYDHECR